MKLNILTELKSEPWGGGNQFLKALRDESKRSNTYSENIENAQIILFNSHHNPNRVLELRKKFKKHIFVHRVDGPMSYRGKSGVKLDRKIFYLNSLVADGTVFQSDWSRNQMQSVRRTCFLPVHNCQTRQFLRTSKNRSSQLAARLSVL